MDAADKRMLEREALRNMIQQWNANRLDLFELSEPNESLEFHGVMRFYFQDSGQKIATKCIRVASDATVSDVIETLIEKFRPDMRMLSLGSYSLWETHGPDDERRLEPHEKPLLVQLNWHADDREGRFLLKCTTGNEQITAPLAPVSENADQNFKRKLSKREKKDLKKKEKLSRLKSDTNNENRPVAEKLYKELPETSFTRSISNPEAVMRRRRQLKLERKLQQFRSKDGGPDTGGTLKIYGSSLCPDVPYKTLLLSIGDTAAGVVREMLDKYGLSRQDPAQYCIVQVDGADNSEYILEDDECPLAIVMTHHHRGSIMFHVRRRPVDSQPRRRKKKTGVGAGGSGGSRGGHEPVLVEVAPDGSHLENGRRIRVADVVEVGSGNGMALQLYGPSIQPRHCVVAAADGGGYTVTPLHPDAQLYLNNQRVTHSQRLQHGCLLKFGRVSTFRFVDPAQENLHNRNLSQSQHFGSGSIYDRSPTSPGRDVTSPASHDPLDSTNANTTDDYQRTMSPVSHDAYYGQGEMPYNNNTLKMDNESLVVSQHHDTKDEYRDEHTGSVYTDQDQNSNANRTANSQYKDNYETTFDLDGNVETKSICSAKSGGSGHDARMNSSIPGSARPGQEAILPAVLEFPEAGQAQFLAAVITRLDPHAPAFKLAPVYTLYLCARYRASTHYRPELTPTERAHKLTAFLHHVATLIHATVQERCTDSAAQAFWMANASELLHFLKCDRHISSFSTQAQELLPTTVQNAFSNLVSCFQEELAPALAILNKPSLTDATEATAPTLQALAACMVLLRRCRVNAALTIQLFSHLFHYINAVCFNKLVSGGAETAEGGTLAARLVLLGAWAERQGLELAADCHLARSHQAARLTEGSPQTAEAARATLAACFKLNSVQVRALLAPRAPPAVVEAAVQHARAAADELYRADGREITLEESEWLGVGLLIPGDGFSAEVVRGVPPGLADFVAPLQRGNLCRLAHQPHAIGVWTVYMTGYGAPTQRRAQEPRVHIIQLNKNSNGMGLSIVAAKGAGQSKLGIYIKSVVAGGAAAADGRLAAGDQLLSVDGHSLVGITQEKAAEYLVRTGPTVTLEVAKQGAVLHGLATLLHQPAYNQKQEEQLNEEVEYEHRLRRNSGTFTNTHPALLRPTSPYTELATAGDRRRSCNGRCNLLRDESSESSSDDSEEYQPQYPTYRGSIPRLIITLDRENDQLDEDLSPDTPGCPLELKYEPPPRPIPVFSFTCEDFDEMQKHVDVTHENLPEVEPPEVPEPPANYDQSSDNGDVISLPPVMEPIDTKLTLDLFNMRGTHNEFYRRRCTGIDECVSACECCRTPQPDEPRIPYIDEANTEPLIFESDIDDKKVTTPKIRRIFPSLSLDQTEESKPETADAECQTPSSPIDIDAQVSDTPIINKLDLELDVKEESKRIEQIHSRLRRALFNVSKSFSNKSEETDVPSTYTTSDSLNTTNDTSSSPQLANTPVGGAKQVLDSVDRKSWKSPDEYRPSFGKVKALTKHFNSINLTYCVKNYKRNCQSSPNLSIRSDKIINITENLQSSVSLADIPYEDAKTDTSSRKRPEKLSEEEVKSILIQLEDWSKYGSRGSEDTLAQGSEFEIPNLPSEDHTDNNINYHFNEIVDKKPRRITLDNIRIKSNQSSATDSVRQSRESFIKTESVETPLEPTLPRVIAMIPQKHALSLVDVSNVKKYKSPIESQLFAQSCPNIDCNQLDVIVQANGPSFCGLRRASERDLPGRVAGEAAAAAAAVAPSRSTPALHQLASPPPALHTHYSSGMLNSPSSSSAAAAVGWSHKSRSSHNLSSQDRHNATSQHAQPHIATVDRWSTLRSSNGSNRPQSAHFSAAAEQPPDSPLLHHQQNHSSTMSVRSAKLAEMSEEVSRRHQHQQLQQMQQQQLQQPQQYPPQTQHKPSIMTHQHIQPHTNMMSPPLMQNIHPNQHQTQMNQGQVVQQNHYQNQMVHQNQMIHPNQNNMIQQNQVPNHMMQQNQHQNHLSQHQNQMIQSQMNNHQHLHNSGHLQSPQQQMHHQPPQSPLSPLSPTSAQPYHNQHGQTQRYEWHQSQPGPPSPQRSQPPVAPKPQSIRRPELDQEDIQSQPLSPQQLMNATQHDDEWYVGGGGVVSSGGGNNPWQREQRERELEARRLAARGRRDATIAQLISLGPNRSPAQNQQLRALQLERDFERRATQQDQEEQSESSPEVGETAAAADRDLRPLPQPKSILKSNRAEVTNGYATDTSRAEEPSSSSSMRQLSCTVSRLQVSPPPPPPPPERGSSFAVMAARALSPHPPAPAAAAAEPNNTGVTSNGPPRDKRVSFHERAPLPAPSPSPSPPRPPSASPPPAAAAPSPSPSALAPPAPPDSEPPPLDDHHAGPLREDPDRFIEQAEHMLASPTSPGSTPGAVTHTPGVIGAQEVYRDPRTRRLAEQRARAAAAAAATGAVPEHLSFKEKMKMFALEAGDPNTPKDKVKISRAQRDIDAVH